MHNTNKLFEYETEFIAYDFLVLVKELKIAYFHNFIITLLACFQSDIPGILRQNILFLDGENLSEKRLTRDEIGNQAKLLLSEFVIDRMKVDGVEGTDCNTVVANLAESGALVLPGNFLGRNVS